MRPTASPTAIPRTSQDVAEFYDKLIFPSRGAHPAYADLVPREPGERIGEFGCGQSLLHETLRLHRPSPVFLDISRNALRTIEYGVRVQADLCRLPFRSATYDRIVCIGVLHHFPDRAPALGEIARVLKPGGRLILGVYAPGTIQSRLRRLYEMWKFWPWRSLVVSGTRLLIDARYRSEGTRLDPEDVRRRARDLLEVPYVEYTAAQQYVREAEAVGFRGESQGRIASMNILHLVRSA